MVTRPESSLVQISRFIVHTSKITIIMYSSFLRPMLDLKQLQAGLGLGRTFQHYNINIIIEAGASWGDVIGISSPNYLKYTKWIRSYALFLSGYDLITACLLLLLEYFGFGKYTTPIPVYAGVVYSFSHMISAWTSVQNFGLFKMVCLFLYLDYRYVVSGTIPSVCTLTGHLEAFVTFSMHCMLYHLSEPSLCEWL